MCGARSVGRCAMHHSPSATRQPSPLRTLSPSDLVYRDRTGEIYRVKYNPAHRWFYVPEMQADEAILIKCYDSAADKARFTAHSAFEDPTAPADVLPRESIELFHS